MHVVVGFWHEDWSVARYGGSKVGGPTKSKIRIVDALLTLFHVASHFHCHAAMFEGYTEDELVGVFVQLAGSSSGG